MYKVSSLISILYVMRSFNWFSHKWQKGRNKTANLANSDTSFITQILVKWPFHDMCLTRATCFQFLKFIELKHTSCCEKVVIKISIISFLGWCFLYSETTRRQNRRIWKSCLPRKFNLDVTRKILIGFFPAEKAHQGRGSGGGLISISLVTRHLPSVASLTVLVEHVSCIVLGLGISMEIRCRRHASFCMVLSCILHSQWKNLMPHCSL